MAEVLVLIDRTEDGAVRHTSLELLTLARALGEPVALWLGELGDGAKATLAEYGASAIVRPVPDVELAEFIALPHAECVVAALEDAKSRTGAPAALLLSSSFEHKEVAARVAVATGSGVVVDVSSIVPDAEGRLVAEQSAFTGSFTVRSVVVSGTPIFAVKPNSVVAEAADAATSPELVNIPVAITASAQTTRVTSRTVQPSSGRPELADASSVVVTGRGVGSDLGVVEDLADVLSAAVGSTRVVVDEGWIDHATQVGQTGVTISPKLYIGAGVSGAIHHRSGMQASQTIVAINIDPEAPIFEIADYGIVGDAATVLPQLTARLRELKA